MEKRSNANWKVTVGNPLINGYAELKTPSGSWVSKWRHVGFPQRAPASHALPTHGSETAFGSTSACDVTLPHQNGEFFPPLKNSVSKAGQGGRPLHGRTGGRVRRPSFWRTVGQTASIALNLFLFPDLVLHF